MFRPGLLRLLELGLGLSSSGKRSSALLQLRGVRVARAAADVREREEFSGDWNDRSKSAEEMVTNPTGNLPRRSKTPLSFRFRYLRSPA